MNKLGIKDYEVKWVWASTEISSVVARDHCFDNDNGDQNANFKTNRIWVRAIRRKPKTSIAFKNKDHV